MLRKISIILAIVTGCLLFNSFYQVHHAWSIPCAPEGEVIGTLADVSLYSNGCSIGCTFWQCTEFARRFYFNFHHFNTRGTWCGSGRTYHIKPGLVTFYNELTTLIPRFGDTIAFEQSPLDTTGHVAIVSDVDEIEQIIYFHQQNWSFTGTIYPAGSVTYTIDSITNNITVNPYGSWEVIGWGRPNYTVPEFSRDDNDYNAVYGIVKQPLHTRIRVLNASDDLITYNSIGVGGRDPNNNIADIGISTNYQLGAEQEVTLTFQRTFDLDGDYRFFSWARVNNQNVLEQPVDRILTFSLLNNQKSVIVDDSQIESNFVFEDYNLGVSFCAGWPFCPSNPNVSQVNHDNYRETGYLYGSILVPSDSNAIAEWHPDIKGEYSIAVFIPGNGCNSVVRYEICSDGIDQNMILSNEINQNDYINQWVPLKDSENRSTWMFTMDGYIRLRANLDPSTFLGIDAVKFIYGIDVALIIDSSGSMGWNDPQDLRKQAAEIFIHTAQDEDQVAIIDFDNDSETLFNLQPLTTDRSETLSSISLIDSSGGTNISLGLLQGHSELSSSTKLYRKAAILLTDGQGYYNNEAELYSSKKWPIYTIGLGYDTDTKLLKEIADMTEGKYFALTDPNQLKNVYFEIAAQIAGGSSLLSESTTMTTGQDYSTVATVPADQQSTTFLTSWGGSDVSTTLVTPIGEEITPATGDPDVYYAKGLTYELYRITNPEAGNWTVNVHGVDLPPEGEVVNVSVSTIGPPSPQDTTPPAITISNPIEGKTYFDHLPTNFNFTIEEPESAIVSQTALLNGVPINNNDNILLTQLGENTLTITATNEANLTSELSITFFVNHFAWLPPIKYEKGSAAQTITYVAQANSTLPIKFAIFNTDNSFIANNSVKVIVEGTTAQFTYGEGDTNIRINQEEGEDPLYIVNLHTNFNKCDYGLEAGNEYNLTVYFNDILAARTKLRIE